MTSNETWTIQKLLNWVTEYLTTKGIESPRLSSELLLCHVLELKRIDLYTQFNKQVPQQQLNQLHDLVKRAGSYEPVAYLTGKTEFYSLELDITADCMIPRPETELLVQRAIEFLRTRSGVQYVCDLCTGSGCIAVAIAKNFPDAYPPQPLPLLLGTSKNIGLKNRSGCYAATYSSQSSNNWM